MSLHRSSFVPWRRCARPPRSAAIVVVLCVAVAAADSRAQQPPRPSPVPQPQPPAALPAGPAAGMPAGQPRPVQAAQGQGQVPGQIQGQVQQPTVPPRQQQPPALTPQQQAELDRLLAAWEARNATIKTWSCRFTKWEYNAWSPVDPKGFSKQFAESTGELKYAAPDKGSFRIKDTKQWNQQTGRYEPRPGDSGEHWVCNGSSIYEFRHTEKQLRETKLPPELQGKAISDGPLPFVFGAKADTLKKRYWMRIVTPANAKGQIWLEARPRFQADAANFSMVELILHSPDLMPAAIQIYKPGGTDRDVYQFDPATNIFDRGLDLIRDFSKPATPFGYRYVLEDQQGQQPPGPATPPGAGAPPGTRPSGPRPPVPANLPR